MPISTASRLRAATFVHACARILGLLLLSAPLHAQQSSAGDRVEMWQGYRQMRFQFAGREAWLVEPRVAAEGRPWIWRMEFFGHEPQADLALLARGFHVAYLDLQNLYGGPPAMEAMDQFHASMAGDRGLAKKVVLEGFSRGGLFSLNWAARHPDRVACIYNDAPVCDMRSWPGGLGRGPGSADDWRRCLMVYGLSEEAARNYAGHPVDNTEPLARTRVPLLHVCGDADEVVPFDENTQLFADRLRAQGGSIFVLAKPGVKHHPHSLANPAAIVNFILAHTVHEASTEILPESPVEYQVVQRAGEQPVPMRISGWIQQPADRLEARVVRATGTPHASPPDAAVPDAAVPPATTPGNTDVVVPWQPIETDRANGRYDTQLSVPPGGWYEIQLRTTRGDGSHAHAGVRPVGVGEVFVIAGQSNSTNHGSERQQPESGMVVTFDGQQWRPAHDPQPGTADGSTGGSFAPALGDALHELYRVPIAVASTGAGATSVRQWLPKDARMKNLPTIDAYVTPVGPGEWACDGVLFEGLARRIESLGPRGCRAVLWHQGESDAGQARSGYPADRQITGTQYAEFLRQLIEATRARAGWEIPWLVARTTYHSEQDPADEEFRGAQRSIVEAGIAIAGPDTDQLRAEYRDGVHFNARGLRAHGRAWADSIRQWLDTEGRGTSLPPRPNIVVIVADDLGWSDLGCYGADLLETPHIDRLASEGQRFLQAYAPSPVCSPTRASLLTGKHPARLHMTIWSEGSRKAPVDRRLREAQSLHNLPLEEVTLAEQFAAAGYLTASVGKWHLGDAAHAPETQGFEVNVGGTQWGAPQTFFWPYRGAGRFGGEFRYVPHLEFGSPGEYLTDRLTSEAIRVIDHAARQQRPLFLWLAHHAPHTPMEAKADDIAHFQSRLRPGMQHQHPVYAAMVRSLDESVGRVRETLTRLGMDDNTIVVFTSDNGGYMGSTRVGDHQVPVTSNWPLRSGKGTCYEGGLRVPLLVRWPGRTEAGATCNRPVMLTDLHPTLAAIASPPLEPDSSHPNVSRHATDAVDIAPLLLDPQSPTLREQFCFHYPHYYHAPPSTPCGAIREGNWKMIEFFEDDRLELYDLASDPGEQTDIGSLHPDIVNMLRSHLHDWRADIGAAMPTKPR